MRDQKSGEYDYKKIAYEVAKNHEGYFKSWKEFEGAFSDYFEKNYESNNSEENNYSEDMYKAMANYDFTWETGTFFKFESNPIVRCLSPGLDPDGLPIILEMHWNVLKAQECTDIIMCLNSNYRLTSDEENSGKKKIIQKNSQCNIGEINIIQGKENFEKVFKDKYLGTAVLKQRWGTRPGFIFKYKKKPCVYEPGALEVDTLFSFKSVFNNFRSSFQPNNSEDFFEKYALLKRFARMSHTVGNFGLIPFGEGSASGPNDTPKNKFGFEDNKGNEATGYFSGFSKANLSKFNFCDITLSESEEGPIFREIMCPDFEANGWMDQLKISVDLIEKRGVEICKSISESSPSKGECGSV